MPRNTFVEAVLADDFNTQRKIKWSERKQSEKAFSLVVERFAFSAIKQYLSPSQRCLFDDFNSCGDRNTRQWLRVRECRISRSIPHNWERFSKRIPILKFHSLAQLGLLGSRTANFGFMIAFRRSTGFTYVVPPSKLFTSEDDLVLRNDPQAFCCFNVHSSGSSLLEVSESGFSGGECYAKTFSTHYSAGWSGMQGIIPLINVGHNFALLKVSGGYISSWFCRLLQFWFVSTNSVGSLMLCVCYVMCFIPIRYDEALPRIEFLNNIDSVSTGSLFPVYCSCIVLEYRFVSNRYDLLFDTYDGCYRWSVRLLGGIVG
jgi:hypothetical protein